MKVAMLTWESLHSVRVGGLGIVVSRQAEELARRGHDVHLFTRWVEGMLEHEYINGVHYHRCRFDPGPNILAFAYNMSKSFVATLHEVEKAHGGFDIIHGHDWHVVEALHDLKNEGRTAVLTFHSTEYGRAGSHFGGWWEFREISGKEWYGGLIADRVTTVSSAMKSELCWLYKIPAYKIDVIPNAIDPRKYQMRVDPGKIKMKYGVHPLAPMVLFMGRLVYQKAPDLLLEAVPKIISSRWDTKVIFAGEGGMKQRLQSRANELGVRRATRFLGWIPYPTYIELLNTADIFCIPSRNEPFGIVMLEAWATGRPLVAADVGGMRDNIENFVDGVKVYLNPDSVAWGVNYLLNNPDIMAQVSENGRQKVRKFRWGNTIQKLLKTYKLALGGRTS